VYSDIKGEDMKALLDIQNNMADELTNYLGGSQNNAESAINQLLSWIQSQPEVESATLTNGGDIEIKYK
jgi:flagellar biosynthesis chaperone FliJ